MRFFIDAEFFEDGPKKPIELISLALVAENGVDSLYIVNSDFDWDSASEWLNENVAPSVMQGQPLVTCHVKIGAIVEEFVARVSGEEEPAFWGYYADYDWVVLCQTFGSMLDLPKSWPMYCNDIKQYANFLGDVKLPRMTSNEHHCLHDAMWNMASFKYLKDKEGAPRL